MAGLDFAYDSSGHPEEGYNYLLKASEIAKLTDDQRSLAYCYTWLAWTCVDLALYEEAEIFGNLAVSLSNIFPNEHYLYFKSRAGLGQYIHVPWRNRKNCKILPQT